MARYRKSLFLLICFSSLLMVLAACSADQPPLAQLSATVATLPNPAGKDFTDSDEPARGARPALTTAKHQLRDWIDAELTGSTYRDDIRASAFADALNSKLKAAKVPVGVRAWSDKGVLIVVTSFGIICGTDDSIYGWSWDGRAWRRVIEHEITDYTPDHYNPETVDDLENVHFAPAGTASDGKSYVLATAVNTWCTSGWQDRRFQLYAVDKSAAAAKLLVDDRAPAFTNEGNRKASLTSDYMAIEYTGGESAGDPRKELFADHVVLFTLKHGGATRISWAAFDAEDFTKRWLAASWSESSAFSASGGGLEAWHDRLRDKLAKKAKDSAWTSFNDPVRCGDSDLFQYGMLYGTLKADGDLDGQLDKMVWEHMPGEPANTRTQVRALHILERLKGEYSQPMTAYFIAKRVSPYRYEMTEVRKTPRPGCPAMGE